MLNLLGCLKLGKASSMIRSFSTSCVTCRNTCYTPLKTLYISRWRREHDIPDHGTEYGPLTDLPDFRHADGRPAALNRGQRNRLVRSEAQAQRISFLFNEIDSAKETHARMVLQRKQEREAILQNKLKEKGQRLKDMYSSARQIPSGRLL